MANWTEEVEAKLVELVGDESPVSQDTVKNVSEALGEKFTPRSVAAKLRKMEFEVEKVGERAKRFSERQEAELDEFLSDHSGEFTYAQIAERFAGGQFTARQVQGKVLSMERTADVAPTPKTPADKKYSEEQEDTYVKMANAGAALEDIASELDKPLNSVRGKGLSLYRAGLIESIPKQRTHVKKKPDALEALGDISDLTVEEIAQKIDKSPRGVRQMITYRGLECKDYKAKPRKNQEAA
jgi:DNA-binding transcriptional ArsR family regulator